MLTGRNFVAHLVFAIVANGQPTIIRGNFRATVERTDDGEYTVTTTDDTATVDATPIVSASPNGGVEGGEYVAANVIRSAAKTFKIILTPATTADAPGVGFPAAPEDPDTGTVIHFTLDRVDTV